MTADTTPEAVPRGALTVRLSPRARRHLERLQAMLDKSQREITELGFAHLLATLEKGRPIEAVVPSDPQAPEPKEKG